MWKMFRRHTHDSVFVPRNIFVAEQIHYDTGIGNGAFGGGGLLVALVKEQFPNYSYTGR